MTNNIKLTKEQEKELEILYDKALDDMWEIWQTSALKTVYIPFDLEDDKSKKWALRLDEEYIRLICNTGYAHSISITLGYIKERFHKTVLLKDKYTKNDIKFNFIKKYEYLREQLIKRLENSHSTRKEIDDMFNRLKNQFNKTATTEIELPPTKKRQTIEVVEESGKKIGMVSFGGISLKIITDANIEFKQKDANEKTKRK